MARWEVQVTEGPPHGDLYELEQTTYYRVVDADSQEVILTFRGEMEASLSTDSGLWDDYSYSGVCLVTLAPDQRSVLVDYHDGRRETVPLPGSPDHAC